jgi:hypothetical protein
MSERTSASRERRTEEMSELKDWQRNELLLRCRLVLPDAEYCPEESYIGQDIDFEDSCGCYSGWTTESCHLYVTLRATLKGDGYEQARELEKCIRKWADGALTWNGCNQCRNNLSVSVHLFELAPKPEERTR